MSRPDLREAMDALAIKAREMLSDPDLKASGLAAATNALKTYSTYRLERDREESLTVEPFRVPRPDILKVTQSDTTSGSRDTVGNPLGHDGLPR